MIRKPRPCARCGEGPRHVNDDGTLADICGECIMDPATREEMRRAIEADRDHPRLWLKLNGWAGGWGRAT